MKEENTYTYALILSSEVQTEPINFSLHAFVSRSLAPFPAQADNIAAVQLVSHFSFFFCLIFDFMSATHSTEIITSIFWEML